ncbi:hypothetical protein TRIUR3_33406 [Triticum urartu]|uniref:Uncharacterized protein n=1 Tax=Triticum urartu TaxID=4572 RepID=M7YVN0_TRIUA|nr:hypothetical protein TRIUR3_33406 [Triticum urartu]
MKTLIYKYKSRGIVLTGAGGVGVYAGRGENPGAKEMANEEGEPPTPTVVDIGPVLLPTRAVEEEEEEKPSKERSTTHLSVFLHSHARARKRGREGIPGSVALGDVMAQPRQQQRQGRLVAALLVLLSLCCLARLGAAASAASADPHRKDGAATALDKAAPQEEEAVPGFTVTTVEERARGRGPVRVVMEVDIEDYPRRNLPPLYACDLADLLRCRLGSRCRVGACATSTVMGDNMGSSMAARDGRGGATGACEGMF